MELYKVTGEDGSAFHGGYGKWTKNRWRSVRGNLVPCENGLHLCRRQDLTMWLGPVIWRAEVDGEVIEANDKVVARKARVVERLDTWNERIARLFAADCAEHVLPIFEKAYPTDDRPRRAIEAARAYANGSIDAVSLTVASDAASDAAWAAARTAAKTAAAAWYAAWAAATTAAGAVVAAAVVDTARYAARYAAEADAARWGAVEREWQTQRLFEYLEGRA